MKIFLALLSFCLFFVFINNTLTAQTYYIDSIFHTWGNSSSGTQIETEKYLYTEDFILSQIIDNEYSYTYNHINDREFEINHRLKSNGIIYTKEIFKLNQDSFLIDYSNFDISSDGSEEIFENKVYTRDSDNKIITLVYKKDYEDVTGSKGYKLYYTQTILYNDDDQITSDSKIYLYDHHQIRKNFYSPTGLLDSNSYSNTLPWDQIETTAIFTYDDQNRQLTSSAIYASDLFNEYGCDSLIYSYEGNKRHVVRKRAYDDCPQYYAQDNWEDHYFSDDPLLEFDSIHRGEIESDGTEFPTKGWKYFWVDSSDISAGNYSIHEQNFYDNDIEITLGSQEISYYTSHPEIYDGVTTTDPDPENSYVDIEIHPNPVPNESFLVNSEKPFDEYSIYDLTGFLKTNQQITPVNNQAQISINDYPSGKYILKLYFDGEPVGDGKVFIVF